MSIRASIDLGSNSILLLIAGPDGIIEDLSEVVALGKDVLKTQLFCQESMDKTYQQLVAWIPVLKKYGLHPNDVKFVATESSRVAKNSQDFFSKIQINLGYQPEIISDIQESYYAAKGILGMKNLPEKFVVCDLGGASTELIVISKDPFQINCVESLKVGSVVYQDLSSSDWDRIKKQLKNIPQDLPFYGIAGCFTTLACIILQCKHFDASKINAAMLSKNQILSLQTQNILALQEEFPYLAKRIPTLASGQQIIQFLMEQLHITNFTISTYGLRHGILA